LPGEAAALSIVFENDLVGAFSGQLSAEEMDALKPLSHSGVIRKGLQPMAQYLILEFKRDRLSLRLQGNVKALQQIDVNRIRFHLKLHRCLLGGIVGSVTCKLCGVGHEVLLNDQLFSQ
jgi:hypothetical protein